MAAAAIALALAAPGCVHHHYDPRPGAKAPGPPPWAPAHGRRKAPHHPELELAFDGELGVYVVVGRQHHFYHADSYYRLHDNRWQRSVSLAGPWISISLSALPPGLRANAAGKQHPGRGHGPPAKRAR